MEISTDGGPEFTAFVTKSFFQTWGVQHRVSSAHFPQSNGRAEVAVKATIRLLMTNVSPNGDLDNDSFLRALLQLRNTPNPQCDLSPAEIVFGHPLRDAFSFVNRQVTFTNRHIRRTWRKAWQAKEDALRLSAGRNDALLAQHTRSLSVLQCGNRVFIQNQRRHYPRKWNKIGIIVEVLPWDQYVIKVDDSGRIIKRNWRFLKVASGGMGNHASPSSVRLAPATPLENPSLSSPPSDPDHTLRFVPQLPPLPLSSDPHSSPHYLRPLLMRFPNELMRPGFLLFYDVPAGIVGRHVNWTRLPASGLLKV